MRRRAIRIAIAALAMTGAGCNTESSTDRALREIKQGEPTFALIREHEPAAYAEMRALVEQTEAAGGRPDQAQLIRRGREIFTRAVMRRVMTAPDELVQRLILFTADQAALLEANPNVCRDLIARTAGDIRSFIPPEMQQRERELYGDLLRSPPNVSQPAANEADAMPVIAAIVTEAEGALGFDEAALQAAFENRGPPLDTCRANGYLMRRLGQLPANEGAPIFRLVTRLSGQGGRPAPAG